MTHNLLPLSKIRNLGRLVVLDPLSLLHLVLGTGLRILERLLLSAKRVELLALGDFQSVGLGSPVMLVLISKRSLIREYGKQD
jgi:hypothetical protein